MVTADDITKVIQTELAAASGWATTIPGGSWFGRGPDDPSNGGKNANGGYPYIVYQIEPGLTRLASGPAYTQPFNVRVAAYVGLGQTVTPQAVEQLMNGALTSAAAQTALQGLALRNVTEKVLHGRPIDGKASYAHNLRAGQDVFLAGVSLEVLVQGDRSVS